MTNIKLEYERKKKSLESRQCPKNPQEHSVFTTELQNCDIKFKALKKKLKTQCQAKFKEHILGMQNMNGMLRQYVEFGFLVTKFFGFVEKSQELNVIQRSFAYILSSLTILGNEFH